MHADEIGKDLDHQEMLDECKRELDRKNFIDEIDSVIKDLAAWKKSRQA